MLVTPTPTHPHLHHGSRPYLNAHCSSHSSCNVFFPHILSKLFLSLPCLSLLPSSPTPLLLHLVTPTQLQWDSTFLICLYIHPYKYKDEFLFICFFVFSRLFWVLNLGRDKEEREGKRLEEESNRAVVWKPGGAG